MHRKVGATLSVLAFVAVLVAAAAPASAAPTIGINVVLNTPVTDQILADLGNHGKVLDVLYEINALTMRTKADELPSIQALPYVKAANPDAVRTGRPIDTVLVTNFEDAWSSWDLDAINVTSGPGTSTRSVAEDGTGVYVAVLDTGLIDMWRRYFPEQRIATEYAVCFGGGGGDNGWVSTQPNKWQHDTDSHGTHVTSTILGYDFPGGAQTGVAPMAKVIPVKVLNQTGSGWSSVIARGIEYVKDLKQGPLASHPVVINMSLGGPVLDAMEKAAIDDAVSAGVIIVASAGNNGTRGMGYPGAYAPVISVAAAGWYYEFAVGCWWYCLDVADPTIPDDFYITDFSSREKDGQDLDVAAPGSWVVGPYQVNMGQMSYYYLGGTSMASPHVAGVVALMLEKDPSLTASEAETILESTALDLGWDADEQGAGMVDAAAALAAVTP